MVDAIVNCHITLQKMLSFIRLNTSANNINLIICFVSGFICLIPLFFENDSNMEDTRLRESLTSFIYRDSSVASIIVSIPLFMDLVTDICKGNNNKVNTTKALKGTFLNKLETLLLLCGMIIQPLVALLPTNTHNWGLTYFCCSKSQLTFVGGAILISLRRHDKEFLSTATNSVTLIFLCLGTTLSAFTTYNHTEVHDNMIKYRMLSDASAYLLMIAGLVFILCCIRWLVVMISKKLGRFGCHKAPEQTDEAVISNTNGHIFFSLVYVSTSLLSTALLLVVIWIYGGNPCNFDGIALFLINLAFIIFALVLNFLTMRMVKLDVLQKLVSQNIHATSISPFPLLLHFL
jgi:hypothetical protein